MTDKLYIGIDPGKSGWGICYSLNPEQLSECYFLTGKEKPHVIGCPELVKNLEHGIPHIADINRDIHIERIIIGIEEVHFGFKNAIRSLNQDIGFIAHAFYGHIVITVKDGEWKKGLGIAGLRGDCSPQDKPDNKSKKGGIIRGYVPVLNEHFGITKTEHEWSAWGICYYILKNKVGDE